jgi:large subunit ribosomal protein L4
MSSVKAKKADGKAAGTVQLPEEVFGVEPNTAVMHQVVTAQLAAARSGTHSTKTRAEVSGGGAKPWRQKGTGRARQGSIRAPHWRGGGIAHGPKPRSYKQRTPKKMVRLALLGALSDRAADDKIMVVDSWDFEAPRTKDAIASLEALDLRPEGERAPRVLMVLDRTEDVAWKSFRNLGERVQLIIPEELNAYDVLVNDWLLFTKATLEVTVARLHVDDSRESSTPAEAGGSEPAATKAPAKKAAATKAPAKKAPAKKAPAKKAPAAKADAASDAEESE